MTIRSPADIKRAQKESLLLRTISELYHKTSSDDTRLKQAYITRVKLSTSKTLCTIFFYMADGEAAFKKLLTIISLYKPSMRKALSQTIHGRYTCELTFKFDDQFEKTEKIEKLLNSLQEKIEQAG